MCYVSPLVTQREFIGQFYATYQESNETKTQFIIQFQNLQKQLTWPPPKEDLKETFQTVLREPLWTRLVILDFKTNTLE